MRPVTITCGFIATAAIVFMASGRDMLLSFAVKAGEAKHSQIPSLERRFNTLAFPADGKWIAAAFDDHDKQARAVGVWEVGTRKPIFISREKEEDWGFEALAFSPDKKLLLAVNHESERNVVTTWDTATGKRLKKQILPRDWRSISKIFIHHAYPTREVLWDNKGKPVLHDAWVGTVTDLATGKIIADYRKYTQRQAMTFGGLVVYDDDQDRDVVLDALTGKTLSGHPPVSGFALGWLSFSKDGKTRSVSSSPEGLIVTRGTPPRKTKIPFDHKLKQLEYTFLSPDGHWLGVVASYREGVKPPANAVLPGTGLFLELYDTKAAQRVGNALNGWQVYFSPDASKLAVIRQKNIIVLVDRPGAGVP